jgi:peptidoglycan/LPS O-acetylase OafA/YrhL
MVLLGHSALYFLPASTLVDFKLQNSGVIIFFLISGFLISHSVFRHAQNTQYDFREYFIDRFFRIYTCYIPAIIVVAIIDYFVKTNPAYEFREDYGLGTAIGNALMFQDFPIFQLLRRLHIPEQSWFVRPFASARPFWTLSVEWWLYMTFGGVFFTFRTHKWVFGTTVALALVSIEPAYHFIGGPGQCLTEVWLLGVVASLVIGQFGGVWSSSPLISMLKGWRVGGCIFGIGITLSCGRILFAGYNPYDLQLILAFSLVVFSPAFAITSRGEPLPYAISFLGSFLASYSYSLYLLHFTLLSAAVLLLPNWATGAPHLVIFVIVANAGAAVFSYIFERHYRSLARAAKSRFGAAGRDPDN